MPGAGDVHSFWTNLQQGRETIKFYDDEELRNLGVPDSDLRDPSYVKAKGRLEDINVFDDELFPIPPAEVDVTSPQLRLLYKVLLAGVVRTPVTTPGNCRAGSGCSQAAATTSPGTRRHC